ncbi:MAG: hypothetical protein KatS3mg111_2832 [Pirellulaceae bacterium]|nr:MAG: hypothetical protein KatS3mg111_2832 [Pirellulaceae bacterium]
MSVIAGGTPRAGMRLGIVGTAGTYYVRRLLEAGASVLGPEAVAVVDYGELACGIGRDGEFLSPQRRFDALIVRSMPLGSLEQVIFRMNCLHGLQRAGVVVLNAPRCLEIAIDKWLTLDRLREGGMLVPPSRVVQHRQAAMQAWEELGGDVVVKPLFGGEGRGLLRLQDADMAWRAFGTLQQLRAVLYVQQFIPHLGYDVRVLVLGDRTWAIRRQAAEGQWRTNISQGGAAMRAELGGGELEIASRCMRLVGGEFLGVDLLPDRDGRLWLLEVNAVPGWRGVESAWGVDIARAVVEHAIAQVKDSVDERSGTKIG